jgi:succinate dehydrogenase / fumarate reductase membrane anchor subunit
MSIRTPIGRVRGHGSARSGTGHFWHQRVTALANVPLTIAFVVIIISLLGSSHARVTQILGSPLVAILMFLFIGSATYHMKLGMQVIIEDYVHDEKLKVAAIIANTFFAIAVAAVTVFAILKLSFGV